MQKGLLTFNKSITNRGDFAIDRNPYQIMPERSRFITDPFVKSFPQCDKENDILIHVSYITRPFSSTYIACDRISNLRSGLAGYVNLAKRLNTKHILIHGPDNADGWSNLGIGMGIIRDAIKGTNIMIHIEVPSMSVELLKSLRTSLEKESWDSANSLYIDSILQFKNELNGQLRIVLDTAHLHANGMNGEQIGQAIESYRNDSVFVHLNGNERAQFTHDSHCQIFSTLNKIPNVDKLMKFVSEIPLIYVAENNKHSSSYDEWKGFCTKHNLDIVPYNDGLSI